jgi:hypothetical protein
MTAAHFTAWLVNDTTCLDQPNMDITVLEDELISADPQDQRAWASKGDPIFHAVTTVDAAHGNIDDAIREAENLLAAAGWRTTGDWEAADTAYTVTIERASSEAAATTTVVLISANPGDRVPGHELGDPDCPDVVGLTEHPAVVEFFTAHQYDADHDDQLMYLVTDDTEIPAGFPALSVTV